MENLVIIGAGTAGLSAAVYAARADLSPLVIKGTQPGGQITLTDAVENYPGYPDGITGFDLFQNLEKHASRFGARYANEEVVSVDFTSQPFSIKTHENDYEAKSVIIATGSDPRKLNVPGEKEFIGKGVSYCATCDGFFYKGKEVVVIGGGDSAIDEGLFLTKFASRVTVIHRRDRLRANQHLQNRAFENEKMDFIWDSTIEEITGENSVTGLTLKNVKSGDTSNFRTDGVFIFIGHIPNTDIFKNIIEMDDNDIILANRRQQTNVPGVFVAGDVQDAIYRQAITSAGTGAVAAMEAEKYLAEMEGTSYPGKF
ncbi:MAG: thioredoxin-disulfide reductase [candidate division KSB1 bacterium]|jgi:thioredoxin reductase (NADPH)|nr:thioredoxin-disulfide reductase [candidate division KSB1 bacterium]